MRAYANTHTLGGLVTMMLQCSKTTVAFASNNELHVTVNTVVGADFGRRRQNMVFTRRELLRRDDMFSVERFSPKFAREPRHVRSTESVFLSSIAPRVVTFRQFTTTVLLPHTHKQYGLCRR